METARLNGVIRALEQGKVTFSSFCPPSIDEAMMFGGSKFDSVVFEMEHNPWDARTLRDCLQYLLNREQIARSGSIAPGVTPLVRIPANGAELNQTYAKQALDLGVYGVIWPHVSTVEQAYNAVSACRYPRLKSAPLYEPAGARGDSASRCARYWGLSIPEYYARADVWPLAPHGEILVVLMIEDTEGVANLDDILKNVPGVGMILFGEGDLTQELGVPRQYDDPTLLDLKAQVVATCRKYSVAVGHPHITPKNIEPLMKQGFNFLMPGPTRSFTALERGLELSGRS